jgi:hypothetical protein
MINKRIVALAVLALAAGCGSKSSDSAGGGGDTSSCAGAIDTGIASMTAARKKMLDEKLGSAVGGAERAAKILERSTTVLEKLKTALNARCTEDKWSPEIVSCMAKVTKREDVQACIAQMPKDQQDKTNAEVMKAMTSGMGNLRMHPPGGMPHGMGGDAPGMMGTPGGMSITPGTPTPTPVMPAPAAPTPAPAAPAAPSK